jgi:hypothetical protein
MGNPKLVKHFFTKVVGVSHRNANGTSRQAAIKSCSVLETPALEHEDENPHDPNAVKVSRQNGQQLGYLPAELAPEIVSKSNRGHRFAVFISNLTGGTRDAPTREVNLLIIEVPPGVSQEEALEYTDQVAREELRVSQGKGCLQSVLATILVLAGAWFAVA